MWFIIRLVSHFAACTVAWYGPSHRGQTIGSTELWASINFGDLAGRLIISVPVGVTPLWALSWCIEADAYHPPLFPSFCLSIGLLTPSEGLLLMSFSMLASKLLPPVHKHSLGSILCCWLLFLVEKLKFWETSAAFCLLDDVARLLWSLVFCWQHFQRCFDDSQKHF